MSRKVGPVGPYNNKTYATESITSRGYGLTFGVGIDGLTAVTAAGQRCIGIGQEDNSRIGTALQVTRGGDSFAIAGGTINTGDYVKVDAVGRMVTIAGTPGEEVLGRAESPAVNVGDELIVYVSPFVR